MARVGSPCHIHVTNPRQYVNKDSVTSCTKTGKWSCPGDRKETCDNTEYIVSGSGVKAECDIATYYKNSDITCHKCAACSWSCPSGYYLASQISGDYTILEGSGTEKICSNGDNHKNPDGAKVCFQRRLKVCSDYNSSYKTAGQCPSSQHRVAHTPRSGLTCYTNCHEPDFGGCHSDEQSTPCGNGYYQIGEARDNKCNLCSVTNGKCYKCGEDTCERHGWVNSCGTNEVGTSHTIKSGNSTITCYSECKDDEYFYCKEGDTKANKSCTGDYKYVFTGFQVSNLNSTKENTNECYNCELKDCLDYGYYKVEQSGMNCTIKTPRTGLTCYACVEPCDFFLSLSVDTRGSNTILSLDLTGPNQSHPAFDVDVYGYVLDANGGYNVNETITIPVGYTSASAEVNAGNGSYDWSISSVTPDSWFADREETIACSIRLDTPEEYFTCKEGDIKANLTCSTSDHKYVSTGYQVSNLDSKKHNSTECFECQWKDCPDYGWVGGCPIGQTGTSHLIKTASGNKTCYSDCKEDYFTVTVAITGENTDASAEVIYTPESKKTTVKQIIKPENEQEMPYFERTFAVRKNTEFKITPINGSNGTSFLFGINSEIDPSINQELYPENCTYEAILEPKTLTITQNGRINLDFRPTEYLFSIAEKLNEKDALEVKVNSQRPEGQYFITNDTDSYLLEPENACPAGHRATWTIRTTGTTCINSKEVVSERLIVDKSLLDKVNIKKEFSNGIFSIKHTCTIGDYFCPTGSTVPEQLSCEADEEMAEMGYQSNIEGQKNSIMCYKCRKKEFFECATGQKYVDCSYDSTLYAKQVGYALSNLTGNENRKEPCYKCSTYYCNTSVACNLLENTGNECVYEVQADVSHATEDIDIEVNVKISGLNTDVYPDGKHSEMVTAYKPNSSHLHFGFNTPMTNNGECGYCTVESYVPMQPNVQVKAPGHEGLCVFYTEPDYFLSTQEVGTGSNRINNLVININNEKPEPHTNYTVTCSGRAIIGGQSFDGKTCDGSVPIPRTESCVLSAGSHSTECVLYQAKCENIDYSNVTCTKNW